MTAAAYSSASVNHMSLHSILHSEEEVAVSVIVSLVVVPRRRPFTVDRTSPSAALTNYGVVNQRTPARARELPLKSGRFDLDQFPT
jgi:hypothetical protein